MFGARPIRNGGSIRIRVGCQLGFDFPRPTPMIVMLNVHFSSFSDLEQPDFLTSNPSFPIGGYHDSFGNWCNRLTAPAGHFTLGTPATAAARSQRPAAPGAGPAGGGHTVPAGQPVLQDRPPVQRRLAPLWAHTAGLGAGAGDLRLRPQPYHLRLRALAGHADRGRSLCRAPRGLPRLHPSRGHVLPVPEHPGALLHRLRDRHRPSAALWSDGFRGLDGSLSRRAAGTCSTRATTSR